MRSPITSVSLFFSRAHVLQARSKIRARKRTGIKPVNCYGSNLRRKIELFSPRDLNEVTIEDWVMVLDNDRLNSILDRLDLTITGRPLKKRYRLFRCLIGQYVPFDFVPRVGEAHFLKSCQKQLRWNFWDNYPDSSDSSQSDNSLLEQDSDLLQFMPDIEQSQAHYVDTKPKANNIHTFGSQDTATSSTVAPPISSTA